MLPRFALVSTLLLAGCPHDPAPIETGRHRPPAPSPSASAPVVGEPITTPGLTVTMVVPPAAGTPVDRLGEENVNAVAFLDEDRVLSFGSRIELWSIVSPHAPPRHPLADAGFDDFIVDAKGHSLIALGNDTLTKVRTRDWSRAGTLSDLDGGLRGASADGRQLFLSDFGAFLRIDTGAMRKLPPLPGVTEKRTADCVAVSTDGARVAAVLAEPKGPSRLYRWEDKGAAPAIQQFRPGSEDTLACAFASTGALLIGTQGGMYVVEKDGKSQQVIKDRYLWRIVADPKRARVAFADADEKVALLDLTTGAVREVGQHLDRVDELAFSPSGDRLASASADDSVVVWDVRFPDQ